MADPTTTAAKVATPIPPTTKERDNKVTPMRMKEESFGTLRYQVVAELGTVKEDLERPDFWAHVASKFQPYTHLTVRPDDGAWFAEALVLSAGRTWAKVKVLHYFPLTSSDVDQSEDFQMEGHTVKYRGEHFKYAVVRSKDGDILKENFTSKRDAIAWLSDYLDSSKPLT